MQELTHKIRDIRIGETVESVSLERLSSDLMVQIFELIKEHITGEDDITIMTLKVEINGLRAISVT